MSQRLHQNRRIFQSYDVSSKGKHLKTFQGRKYEVKGYWCVNNKTGERELVANIYDDIRTLKNDQFQTVAKRKSYNEVLQEEF